MKKYLLLWLVLACAGQHAGAASSSIVISQVYGGGGNSGATYRNDYIELFNRGTSMVSLSGWSVQYAAATGTFWEKTMLSGSIPAGGYYLIQELQGAGNGISLPTPNAIGTLALSAVNGKIALVNNSVVIAQGTSCPSGASIIDLVGYGKANCSEGIATLALTNTTAAIRVQNGCGDTDNNRGDFVTGAPMPRHSATPAAPCSTAIVTYKIIGHVKDSSGNPVAGVVIMLAGGATRKTDANGRYAFAKLAGGNYQVTPQAQSDYTFQPSSRAVTLPTSGKTYAPDARASFVRKAQSF